ncbi:MAG TPA: hypothetical protein VF725_05815 [Ktedonobacterales bacterium]
MADARYMAACLAGEPAEPPNHWTAEQRAAWAAVLADDGARAAALAWAMVGWVKLERETAVLDY